MRNLSPDTRKENNQGLKREMMLLTSGGKQYIFIRKIFTEVPHRFLLIPSLIMEHSYKECIAMLMMFHKNTLSPHKIKFTMIR